MERRNVLKGLAAFTALHAISGSKASARPVKQKKIKPAALKPGDKIGIISPGTAVSDPDDIAKAIEAAEFFGFQYKFGSNLIHGSGYKTRSPKERLEDLHSMFEDKGITGVFCIRGGYGSHRLLDGIDYDLIRNNPKVFCGYSDITALHLAIGKLSGLVTFHGPVMLSTFSSFTLDYFNKAIFSNEPMGMIENPPPGSALRKRHQLRTLVPGKASGELIGGNMTLISTLMGTEYEIETKGKILYLEDVGEEPYRIDRMLTQLKLAGKLEEAAGIIIGLCSGCDYSGLQSSRIWDYSLGEVLDDIIGKMQIPAVYGYNIGHTADQITMPNGIKAEIDTENKTFNIIEAATV